MRKQINTIRWVLKASAICAFVAGCVTQPTLTADEQSANQDSSSIVEANVSSSEKTVQNTIGDLIVAGDLVTVNYTLRLEDGSMIFTTDSSVANDVTEPKAEWFQAPENYGPEEILAGNDNKRHELALNLVGMTDHEEKQVILPPEKGFGAHDPKKVATYGRIKKIPKLAQVKADVYVSRFGKFPTVGQEVNFVPYFKSRIVQVGADSVTLEALAEDGKRIEEKYGVTTIRNDGETVVMDLDPAIGAPFNLKGQWGLISSKDEKSFSVDFNHPAAGQSITMDIKVVSVRKASAFDADQLGWIEDHDEGYAAAAEAHKPMVMVLYADWCGFCKKLFNQTIPDPRVHDLWDDFVWVKVNSDKNKEYKMLYEQSGFPLVVMTNDKGEVISKINGFKDARDFRLELEKCLEAEKQGSAQS